MDTEVMMVNQTQKRQIRVTVSDGKESWRLPIVETYREAIDLIAEACRSGLVVVEVEKNR